MRMLIIICHVILLLGAGYVPTKCLYVAGECFVYTAYRRVHNIPVLDKHGNLRRCDCADSRLKTKKGGSK